MTLRDSRNCKRLTPLLMTGPKKERGRELGVWFPSLVLVILPQLWPKEIQNAGHGEKLDQGSGHLDPCL